MPLCLGITASNAAPPKSSSECCSTIYKYVPNFIDCTQAQNTVTALHSSLRVCVLIVTPLR